MTLLLLPATASAADASAFADMDASSATRDVRSALRENDYAQAIRSADVLINAATQVDEALYLKALAQHHAGAQVEAIETLDVLLSEHSDSVWFAKSRFLKADALVRMRRFEAAESILEAEAKRLLSSNRKEQLASVFIDLADVLSTEPDPNDLTAPPANHHQAYVFYGRALQMEIDRALRDDVLYKMAVAAYEAKNYGQAVTHLREYLHEFDPQWTGPVGSLERMRGMTRQVEVERGSHVLDARYYLGKSQLAQSQWNEARQNFEDLLSLLAEPPAGLSLPDDTDTRIANTSWQVVRTFHLPGANALELDLALDTARRFLKNHRSHRHSVEAAWLIAQTLQNFGRADKAVEAYETFIAGENYELPDGELALAKIERLNLSPMELEAQWRPLAMYSVGQTRYQQRQFTAAIEAWTQYVNQFPNGPHWSTAQQQIVDAQYMIALDTVASEQYTDARLALGTFLAANPLDRRAPQVLFILGEIEHAQSNWRRAIAEWDKLISKYPGTEESSLALYRTGLILEEKLAEHEAALAAYRRLTWGSWASHARARVAAMTQKQLRLETERTYRTNETPQIRIATRNIESVTVRQYFLDPEAYFRKTHTIGGVESLDIALIEPDRTWQVPIADYAKYKPLDQMIDVPFSRDSPGVCIVNVSEEDWEATTLVVRSDIDMTMRTSRREAIVFVQNMRSHAPADGVTLLFSDGTSIIATETAGDDGVFHGSFDTLSSIDSLRVFAMIDGHVASNALSLNGLQLSQGLSRKGYIYTERPVYQPGQVVNARGILRDVANGSYALPSDNVYIVSVQDSSGRMLREAEHSLTPFGTFDATFTLDSAAAVGSYTITARPKGSTTVTYSGHFEVEQFQLQKMELAFDFDRFIYDSGEVVEGTLRARYYWGEPVSDQMIRYSLPDGRSFNERTDRNGEIAVSFDTSGVLPGSMLSFYATIPGEDVAAQYAVYLPRFGFNLAVTAAQPLAMAGEPFDVTLETTQPDGSPIGTQLTATVLRRATRQPDPVLSNVPWVGLPGQTSAEVTVEEHTITTDAKTGRATLSLTLDDGGDYIIRVAGEDRFGEVVVAQTQILVSDDNDSTKLRIFADSNTLRVGDDATFRLHSRVDEGLVLITLEGEAILEYRIINIKAGENPITLDVDHEHFPNFALSATMIVGRALHTATKPFEVQRELLITIKPLAESYEPGETGTIEILATDQLGNPVEAELSLAVVNEALLAQYPDSAPEILSFFQEGARRFVEFRVTATNAFSYTATTQATIKAFSEEQERLARAEQEDAQLKRMAQSAAAAPRPAPEAAANLILSDADDAPDRRSAGRAVGYIAGGGGGSLAGQRDSIMVLEEMKWDGRPQTVTGVEFAHDATARREHPEDGWWSASIKTDSHGRAVINIPMPETTSRWALIARGVTTNTLVGEARSSVITKKQFFIDVKSPLAAMEGDRLQLLARIHDLTGYVGEVDLELTVASGERTFARTRKTVKIGDERAAEVLFDAFDVPAVGELSVTVRAATRGDDSLSDAITRLIAIHPYGIQYAANAGGVSSNSARMLLELPGDLRYSSQWMTITVGPNLVQQIIDMALGHTPLLRPAGAASRMSPDARPIYGRSHGSELLAAMAGLNYAAAANAAESDRAQLNERVRSLISTLVVTQQADGGWSWGRSSRTDFYVTATAYWALSTARSSGFAVNDNTMNSARALLERFYQQAASADHEQRAIVLHALAASGHADFKLANSLYRERNGLTPIALAYAALTLAELDRDDMAAEVLAVLENRALETKVAGRTLVSWHEAPRYHPWLSDRVETTAVSLLALMQVRPTSRQIEPAAQYLLQEFGCFGFTSGRSRGPGIRALAQYFQQGQFGNADFELIVSVNGNELQTISADGSTPVILIDVPVEHLRDGRNDVDFNFRGSGRYAYSATLRGFSSQFRDTNSLPPYIISRSYYHAPLDYRGVMINAPSTSPVSNLEIGQRTRVYVNVHARSHAGHLVVEESLPAGTTLVPGSLQGGSFSHYEVRDGKIIMFIPQGQVLRDYSYELVAYATGAYRILPTIIRDAFDPSQMRVHKAAAINVLAPGAVSDDPYIMNDAERYALGKAYFDDGLYGECLTYLWPLFDRDTKYQEREVARMLLWAHTTEEHFNAERIVAAFELLSVRHPDLNIPFDRILRVGDAYRYIGEFERAWLVFRATIESSFRNDSQISAVLEDEGQLLRSLTFQMDLWWQYPDIADVATSYFAVAQTIYDESPNAHRLTPSAEFLAATRQDVPADLQDLEQPTRVSMVVTAISMLDDFLALYPTSPLRDDAAFSITNAFLDLKDYDTVIELSETYASRFSDSDFITSFQYMEALGWFWQRAYEPAIKAATVVANGDSRDRDFARYMLGQIHHAQGDPASAIRWYQRVQTLYPDAREAIDYFQQKMLTLPEVSIFKPGEMVDIEIDYRNISDVSLQVYKVDLMKLYLREKNLSNITEVNLAGIAPQHVESFKLGDGLDYMDKQRTAQLALEDEGAYLVICRGDNLFTSGLVLITPLELEVQEDTASGRVRVNVMNAVDRLRPAEVHVKVIGSQNSAFEGGDTDLRGIFVADGINGNVTAIARDADARYAFYRGETWVGPAAERGRGGTVADPRQSNVEVDFEGNLRQQQLELQRSNRAGFDAYRRAGEKGVEVQKAK